MERQREKRQGQWRTIFNLLFLLPFLFTGGCGTHICFPVCSNHHGILSFQTTSKKIPLSIQLLGFNCSQKQMEVFPLQGTHLPWETVPCWLVGDKAGAHSQNFLPPFQHTANWQLFRMMAQGYKDVSLFPRGWCLHSFLFFLFLFWSDFQRSVLIFPLIILKLQFYSSGFDL